MNLHQLRTFCEVAGVHSFTKAARNLHYAQSTVTSQIQNLEDFLGTPLFERGSRGIVLTDAGVRLLPYANAMLSLAESAHRHVARSPV